MDVNKVENYSQKLEEEPTVGIESVMSEEDLQLTNEEEDGEVTEEINKPAQNEDELDFEEENESIEEGEDDSDRRPSNKEEDEDGELNSDDDLEEGEVKDDEDDGDDNELGPDGLPKKRTKRNLSQSKTTNVCRFFAKGQCTWGHNCRFLHLSQPVVPLKVGPTRAFPFAPQTSLPPLRPFRPSDDFCSHPPLFPHVAPPIPRHPLPPPHIAPPLLPPPPPQVSTSSTESAWERGLRHAKEMIVKATKRKEEEIDFDDKRFNAGVDDDEATSHSRHSHHSKNSEDSYSYEGSLGSGRSPSNYHSKNKERHSNREEYWNSEYERRRRLAFESAPWNDEQTLSSRTTTRSRESAEHYRDPWRRSKSPPSKWNSSRKNLEGSSGSKRSHSMSSISGTESGSDVSGSESFSGSDNSFTGSNSIYSDGSDISGRSPRSRKERPRHRDKPRSSVKNKSKPPSHPTSSQKEKPVSKPSLVKDRAHVHVTSKNRSSRSSIDDEANNTGLNKKLRGVALPPPPPASKPRRDSWSDSESGSMSRSGSSMYSGSETGDSDAFSAESDVEEERKMKNMRIKEGVKYFSSKSLSNQHISKRSKIRSSASPVPEVSGPSKKAKVSQNTNPSNKLDKQSTIKSRHSSPPLSSKISLSPSSPITKKVAHFPNTQNDATQKKPIKMTFMKKHPSLKKDRNVTAKLNGSRGESEEESETLNTGRRSSSSDVPLDEMSPRKEENKMTFKETLPVESKTSVKSTSAKGTSASDRSSSSSSSRREDLLKQLKAVEAAIAKKRAKLH